MGRVPQYYSGEAFFANDGMKVNPVFSIRHTHSTSAHQSLKDTMYADSGVPVYGIPVHSTSPTHPMYNVGQSVTPTWAKCPYCGKRNKINDLGECIHCGGNLDARVI